MAMERTSRLSGNKEGTWYAHRQPLHSQCIYGAQNHTDTIIVAVWSLAESNGTIGCHYRSCTRINLSSIAQGMRSYRCATQNKTRRCNKQRLMIPVPCSLFPLPTSLPKVWRRAFNEAGALAPLLYLLSPPAYDGPEGSAVHGVETLTPATTGTRSGSLNRRVPSFLLTSGPTSGGGVRDADIGIGGGISKRVVMGGERPLLEAGPAARTQATRMIQVLIAGSAGVAPVVRPQVS